MRTRSKTLAAQPAIKFSRWIDVADRYAREAIADKAGKKFCKWVRLAAQRFLDDIKAAQKSTCAFYLCPNESDKVCNFFQLLPHIEGRWATPTITLEPWQVFLLVNIFGFRRKDTGVRRFTEVYVEVARKNAKSVFGAGVGLYCLLEENEVGPQIKTAATTGDQARIVFDVMKKMVERLPYMRQAYNVEPLANIIACYKNGGTAKPINAKASTQDGLNPHCNIIDELHAHKTRELFDVLHSAQGARSNPLNLMITTAGVNSYGVCFEQRTYLTKILQKIIPADHYFGIIYTLDGYDDPTATKKDDPLDPANWVKANPNYGVSIFTEKMRTDSIDAQQSSEKMAEFKTKRLNIWVTAKNGYIDAMKWAANKTPIDLDALEGVPCWGAFDLSSVSDLTAFRLVWQVGDRIKTWGRFYLPESTIAQRTEKNGIPYRTWVDQGHIIATPGQTVDYEYIEEDIKAARLRFNIQNIAFDEWNSNYICTRLDKEGVPLVQFIQGTKSFNGPMREIERMYLNGKLDHGCDPVLTWNASNVVARKDVNNNYAPDKKHSFEKIDGFVALAMAVGIMIRNDDETEGPSVYETRGLAAV